MPKINQTQAPSRLSARQWLSNQFKMMKKFMGKNEEE